jgi:hypothetical protein
VAKCKVHFALSVSFFFLFNPFSKSNNQMYTITPLLQKTLINPTYGFEIHLTIPCFSNASTGTALDLKLEITIRRPRHNLTYFTYQCASGGYYYKCNETSLGGDLCKIMATHIISTTMAIVYKWSSFEEPLLDTDYVSTLLAPHLRWYDRYTQRLTWKRLRKSQFLNVQLKLLFANDGNRVTPAVIWEQICNYLDQNDILRLAIALA